MADRSFRDSGVGSSDASSGHPRLRLAGTTAGPVTPAEQEWLDLRQAIVQASSHLQRDAAMIRGRLQRSGRMDPIGVTTGSDAFEHAQAEVGRLLSAVEDRLGHHVEPEIEVLPGVDALLHRS